MLDFEGLIQGQALWVAAKSAAILDCHSTRWRSRTAVGAEEWLRRVADFPIKHRERAYHNRNSPKADN